MDFIAIVGFAMALEAFWYKGDNLRSSIVFVLATTVILYIILFLIEILKKSKNKWIDKFFYHITICKKKYYFEKIEIEYEYLSILEMKYTKQYNLIAIKKFNKFRDRYKWSGTAKNASKEHIIDATSAYTVGERTEELGYNYFTIDLKRLYRKRERVCIPITISNLKNEDQTAKPFLGLTITEKTKDAEILVKIPKKLNPVNARFSVFMGDYTEDNRIGKPEPITYDEAKQGFFKEIPYPRKGRRYAIEWNW